MATGFLHPGAMGASLAAACTGDRLWCSTGRSPATRARAEAAGLIDVGTLEALVGGADTIVSVCPPTSAAAVADSVATLGFEGTYVDANAIAPATTRAIGERFARFVDGGVIGPPAKFPGTTRLYLSGADSSRIAELWTGSAVETRVVKGDVGAASAVKMCFAAWTKGTAALLLAIRAGARAGGGGLALLEEWATSLPELAAQSERAAANNASKAWRFAGELDEIAASFTAHGLPGGFGRAASEVYERLEQFRDVGDVTVDSIVDALLDD